MEYKYFARFCEGELVEERGLTVYRDVARDICFRFSHLHDYTFKINGTSDCAILMGTENTKSVCVYEGHGSHKKALVRHFILQEREEPKESKKEKEYVVLLGLCAMCTLFLVVILCMIAILLFLIH